MRKGEYLRAWSCRNSTRQVYGYVYGLIDIIDNKCLARLTAYVVCAERDSAIYETLCTELVWLRVDTSDRQQSPADSVLLDCYSLTGTSVEMA